MPGFSLQHYQYLMCAYNPWYLPDWAITTSYMISSSVLIECTYILLHLFIFNQLFLWVNKVSTVILCRSSSSDPWLLRPWPMQKEDRSWLLIWRFCLSLQSCCPAWSAGYCIQVRDEMCVLLIKPAATKCPSYTLYILYETIYDFC